MLNNLRAYMPRNEGNVSVMFAIAIVPLLLAAGSAIDYVRYNKTRTGVQAALDGAALAAALPASKSDNERIAIATEYFQSNFDGFSSDEYDFDVAVSDDTILANIRMKYPTTFLHLGGIANMDIDEQSEVMRPFAGKAEVALVLDYSLSMDSKNKYQDMSAAATTMINNLDAAIDDGKLKVGLVPFSAMVYTSMDKSFVTQSSASQTWTGCTQDRIYPNNTNVDTPTSDDDTKWGYVENSSQTKGAYKCSVYDTKNLKIVPLTDNIGSVTTKLAQMRPLGYTNIPLGAEFGWNLLDPGLPYDEALPYSNKKNKKFLVLLTDGLQTTSEFGKNGNRSKQNGEKNLVSLCDGMRAKGITVFAIAYDINDPKVTDLLKACAPGRYYEPDAGGTAINQVFSQITKQITNRIARVAR